MLPSSLPQQALRQAQIKAKIRADESILRLSELEGRVDDTRLAGQIEGTKGTPPHWTAKLWLGTLRLGDYLPAKLSMDSGENVIYAVLPGPDYAGALLFFFANGKAARVDLTAYKTTSNRRKLTGAYSDKAPLACIRRLDTDCELAVYSTEPRALIFHTALLAPKTTRTTQGVAVMTLKPKYQLETVKALEDTPITNQSRYRVRSLPAAGALLREEDSEERQMDLLD